MPCNVEGESCCVQLRLEAAQARKLYCEDSLGAVSCRAIRYSMHVDLWLHGRARSNTTLLVPRWGMNAYYLELAWAQSRDM